MFELMLLLYALLFAFSFLVAIAHAGTMAGVIGCLLFLTGVVTFLLIMVRRTGPLGVCAGLFFIVMMAAPTLVLLQR